MSGIKSSLSKGINEAEASSRKLEYSANVRLTSSAPFTLEEIRLEDGPHKGCRAIILKEAPEKHFPFLKLPSEIRNMIYKELLVKHDQKIVLGGRRYNTLREVDQTLHPTFGVFGGISDLRCLKGPRKGKEKKPSHRCAILQVSRKVHDEAASVFYGVNTFVANHQGIMMSFMKGIGKHRRYVERLHYSQIEFSRDCIETIDEVLMRIPNLRSLKLQFDIRFYGPNPEDRLCLLEEDITVGLGRLLAEVYECGGRTKDEVFKLIDCTLRDGQGCNLCVNMPSSRRKLCRCGRYWFGFLAALEGEVFSALD